MNKKIVILKRKYSSIILLAVFGIISSNLMFFILAGMMLPAGTVDLIINPSKIILEKNNILYSIGKE